MKKLDLALKSWIEALDPYSFEDLCRKPSPVSWSIGQVYMHLVSETGYFIAQAEICLRHEEDTDKEASPSAKIMFENNSFPDEIIEGPSTNSFTAQPHSKEQLCQSLQNLRNKLGEIELLFSEQKMNGKTKHPGLNYFSADEWLQFADMHLRHHLKQKKRIDDFLEINK